MTYPVISISGNVFERGVQYGSQVPERIRKTIDFYKAMFQTYGVSWREAQLRAKSFIEYIEEYLPDGLEEMRGIAEGAKLSFDEILTINCRSEILFAFTDGCTCLGVLSSMSKDGHTYLGQNWDWLRRAEEGVVIVKIEEPKAPRQIMCAEAGIIGGKGLNEAGVGVGLNALSVGRGQKGVPLHVMYRSILRQETISNAIGAVASAKRAGAGNFAMGSSEDFLFNVEFTPDNFDVIGADDLTPLAHTNHYLSSIFQAQDTFKRDLPCTFVRLNRLKRLMAKQGKDFDCDILFDILRDHKNYPDSICSHEDPADIPGKQICTIYAVIMDLTEKKLWITDGNPCVSRELTEVGFD